MKSLRSAACWGLLLAAVFAGPKSGQPRAAELTAAEQELLSRIDLETAQQITAGLTELKQWQETYQAVRGALEDLEGATTDLDAAPNAGENPTEKLFELVEKISRLAGLLGKYSDAFAKLSERLKQVEAAVAGARFDAEELDLADAEELKSELRDFVRSEAAEDVLADVKAILDVVEKMKNPAQYARDFLANEIEKKYFNQPYPVGEFKFTLKRDGINASKSLFAEDAGIVVAINYSDKIEVEARGLYFRYRADGLPEPMLDKLTVDDSQLKQQFVGKTLDSLAAALPDSLGLPIKINGLKFLGFEPGGEKQKPGGIQFDIEMSFSESLSEVALKGENVVIYPDGDFSVGRLAYINKTIEIPLPGIPALSFQGFEVSYAPNGENDKPPEISGKTRISTTGSARLYALELTLTVALPVKRIDLEGDFILLDGNLSVAWVKTSLDFTDGSLSGEYAIPGKGGNRTPIPIAGMLASTGSFRLDGTGFVAKGDLDIYGKKAIDAEIAIMFNGYGYVTAGGGIDVFGQKVTGELSAGYTPGFKEFWLDINMTVTGVSLKPWGELDVTVGVYTNQEENGLLWLYADAGVASVSVPVPDASLAALRLPYLVKLLEKSAVAAYHEMLDNMAKGEKDGRKWAAAQEKKGREWIDKHWGFTGSTGNPQLDAIGGKFSDGGKELGGLLADWREKTGKELTEGRENVQGFFENPGGTTSDELGRFGKKLGL